MESFTKEVIIKEMDVSETESRPLMVRCYRVFSLVCILVHRVYGLTNNKPQHGSFSATNHKFMNQRVYLMQKNTGKFSRFYTN